MLESPFSAMQGIRELQYAFSEYSAWIQYVCINGQDSEPIRKGWLGDTYKSVKGFLGGLLNRNKPDIDYPENEAGLENYETDIFKFLETDWNEVYDKYQSQNMVVSMIAEYMKDRHNRDIHDYSLPEIDDALHEFGKPSLNNLPELYRDEEIVGKRNYKKLFAETAGSNWIAVYDENGERSGKAYETMRDIYRKIMVESFETGKPMDDLRKKFINIENLLPDSLDEKTRQEILDTHLNRDFFRLAVTEANMAEGNGRVLAAVHHGNTYGRLILGGGQTAVSRSAFRNRSKKVAYQSCSKCKELTQYKYRVFPSQSDFEESEFFGGDDIVINDPKADFALWPGKNNVGRPYSEWWGTPGSIHPHCSCMFRSQRSAPDYSEDLGDEAEEYSIESLQKAHIQGIYTNGIFTEHTCSHI
jgi:hypothetical protein